jgi:hypothetical protein
LTTFIFSWRSSRCLSRRGQADRCTLCYS